MKDIRVTFTAAEFKKIKAGKEKKESWHDYIIRVVLFTTVQRIKPIKLKISERGLNKDGETF